MTDSGLALKLIVPFTEMMKIIPTLAENIGQVVDFEYTDARDKNIQKNTVL